MNTKKDMAKPKINEEEIHDQLWFDLCDAADKAKELSVPHVVHVGIEFFTRMALECSPDEIEGLGVVMNAVKHTKTTEELKELECTCDE